MSKKRRYTEEFKREAVKLVTEQGNISKVSAIQKHFARLIGSRINRYETAELLHDDGTWGSWPDLPIRIYTESNSLISVSWSRFDDLWLANDHSLPFAAVEATTRWIENGVAAPKGCLERTIHGVMLGRGEMSIEGREIEIWTRLVMDLGDRWFEIFNALDENGYDLHTTKPIGEFIDCI